MSSPPLISVVTVVRNAAPVIAETMDSVFEQSFPDYEYLVLDGASSDSTADRIRSRATKLAYFSSEPDAGIYDAMNRAVGIARGEFIYFLNAGDRLYSATTLALIATQLREGCDFYSARVRLMSARGEDLRCHYPDEGPSFEMLWKYCCISHQASFLRRTLLLDLGGFDRRLRSSGDYDLWFRLRRAAPRATFSMDTVAWYRDGGLSAHRQTRRLRNLEDVEILLRHGVIGPRSALLLRLVRGHPPLRRRLARWFGSREWRHTR